MTGRKLITSRGFTLVELLVAITIIGLLMAVAIPAITRALGTARVSAVRTEVEVLAQGVEAYKLKYGDYPPDFSDWNLAVRHYRTAFPDITVRELNILQRQIQRGGMDRAEALVWNLGGFSRDSQRPFTGPGGPLQEITPHIESEDTHPRNFAYNSSRDNVLIDFDLTRLTMGEYNPDPEVQTALSTEEGPGNGDLFPVYLRTNGRSPYIYFDSRTYGFAAGEFNVYAGPTGREWGRTRPYLSSAPVSPTEGAVGLPGGGALAFMNPRSFQIISAGLDDSFGSLVDFNNGPLYFAYPTGAAYTIDTSQTPPVAVEQSGLARYGESNQPNVTDNHHFDNITNFAESILENDLP